MKQLTWPTVVLLGILGAVAVALAALTDWTSSDILALIGLLGGIGGAGIGGGAVAGKVADRADQIHEMVATVERQTNGDMDKRFAKLEGAIVTRVLQELRNQGEVK